MMPVDYHFHHAWMWLKEFWQFLRDVLGLLFWACFGKGR